jgi:NAD(P)-dependent dehydrogenase (short-subunit alcohol dehydrogenase family)
MDLGLTGERVLVTGASTGIGLAITSALVAEGAHVVAGSRSVSDELRQLIDEGQVRQVSVDLSTADGPTELVASALEDGPLDVLVNNVGAVTPRLDGFLSVTDDQGLTRSRWSSWPPFARPAPSCRRCSRQAKERSSTPAR